MTEELTLEDAHGGKESSYGLPAENEPSDIGARLKKLRILYGLSQRELARRADVTNGMISLIEQNRTSPSVGVLKKVLDGFPISLSDFFSGELEPDAPIFYRAPDLVEIASGEVSYRQVGPRLRSRALQMLHECYRPGADTGKTLLSHQGEESGIVISGSLEVTVGGKTAVLKAGDAYYFNSRLPHRFRNPGREDAIVVSACTPPSF